MKKIEKILVLGTGGTIAGTAAVASSHTGYAAAQLPVQDLLGGLVGVDLALRGHVLQTKQVAQLDSKDMDHGTWLALAQCCEHGLSQPDVAGVVITHGTDTLEETAWFLQEVLQPAKPVVLTCAMRPATAIGADGPQNLLDALTLATQGTSGGVYVVCAGVVHTARHVQKVHTYRLDAFSSGEFGPLAWLEDGSVRWARGPAVVEPGTPVALSKDVANWPQVAVVTSHAGGDRRQVDALVAAGVKGLVVAGTGNGSVHHALEAALQDAQKQGVAVRRVTRCGQGAIVGASANAGPFAVAPEGLSAVKARISLMLALMRSD